MSDAAPRASLHTIAATVRTSGDDDGARLARFLGVPATRMETLVVGLVLGLTFAVIGIGPAVREHIAAPAAVPAPATSATIPAATATAPTADPGAVPLATVQPAVVTARTATSVGATPPADAAPTYADGGPFGSISMFAPVHDGVPAGLAVAEDGSVYAAISDVAGKTPPRVTRFSPSGVIDASWVVGTEPASLTGVAVAGDGAVLTLSSSPASLVRIDGATGVQSTVTELDDLPPCIPVLVTERCEPAPFDNPPRPTGILVLGDGSVLITDAGQATVWRVPAGGGDASVWHQSADYVAGEDQAGLAALTAGNDRVLLSVGVTALSPGGVVELTVSEDGAANEATWLYRAATGEAPAGISVGDGGDAYLALSGTNELLVLAADGTVAERITPSEPGDLAAPDGIARRGGSVLVSNRSTDARSIVRVSVTDAGAR